MNELQEKWVEALESGEYKQGKTYLRDSEDKYCCLGVACEVMGIEPVKRGVNYEYNNSNIFLRNFDELDLRNHSGAFLYPIETPHGVFCTLMGMNDEGIPFKDIAQCIRDNEELVFE